MRKEATGWLGQGRKKFTRLLENSEAANRRRAESPSSGMAKPQKESSVPCFARRVRIAAQIRKVSLKLRNRDPLDSIFESEALPSQHQIRCNLASPLLLLFARWADQAEGARKQENRPDQTS